MSTLSAPLSAWELLDPTKVKIVCRDAPPDADFQVTVTDRSPLPVSKNNYTYT